MRRKEVKMTSIRDYWEERARNHLDSPAATTEDVFLRELEVKTITQTLLGMNVADNATILDVGCGDGYSTLLVARAVPFASFHAIDYSESMIRSALRRLETQPELKNRVTFIVGDVTDLETPCNGELFDIAVSDRCLINLESAQRQSHAIAQIASHVKPGGYYIAIENFIEGHENMNIARQAVGLPEIPVRWHNLYFKEEQFVENAGTFFHIVEMLDFSSSYYFATRVIYSAMCQMTGQKPDYHHEIHRLAVQLPWVGQFSPIRMAVLRRRSD